MEKGKKNTHSGQISRGCTGTEQSGTDSCHSRVIRNQQNLYPKFPPTAVVKLLQYSGLGSNTWMGFLRTNDLSEVKTGELNLDFGVWVKIGDWLFTG